LYFFSLVALLQVITLAGRLVDLDQHSRMYAEWALLEVDTVFEDLELLYQAEQVN